VTGASGSGALESGVKESDQTFGFHGSGRSLPRAASWVTDPASTAAGARKNL